MWGATTVAWKPGGQRLESLIDSSGALVSETFGYDSRGRLESVASTRGGAPLTSVRYGFDGRGNRISETQPMTGGAQRLFGYDTADRLTAWTEWDGTATALKLRADGSRDEERQYLTPGSPVPTGPPSLSGGNGYVETAYRKYGYDTTGALGSIATTPTGGSMSTVTYAHDAEGRRISETPGSSSL